MFHHCHGRNSKDLASIRLGIDTLIVNILVQAQLAAAQHVNTQVIECAPRRQYFPSAASSKSGRVIITKGGQDVGRCARGMPRVERIDRAYFCRQDGWLARRQAGNSTAAAIGRARGSSSRMSGGHLSGVHKPDTLPPRSTATFNETAAAGRLTLIDRSKSKARKPTDCAALRPGRKARMQRSCCRIEST